MARASAFPTLREAIHHTVTRSGVPMKAIAADLDWSPSQLSMATTLGDEGRPFPADDAHLVKLMRLTDDHSVLMTLAELLGYEVRAKESQLPRLVAEVRDELRVLAPKIQMILDLKERG